MNDPFSTLDGTLEQVWQRLGRGVADRRSAARHPVLATIGAEGAEARVVVLRGVDREAGTLSMHTDTASAKVAELRATPRATLLIWDEKAKFQMRLRADISLTEADQEAWAKVPEGARAVYGGTPTPGTAIDNPATFTPAPALERFCVLTAHVREIETLYLGTPHARASFRDGAATWLAP